MTKLTYMPEPHDNDETTVGGITFKAYEPTQVDDSRVEIITKLKRNPWFTDGEPDPARYSAWKLVRDSKAMADQHRDFADKVEADAIAKAKAARAELAKAPAAAPVPVPEASAEHEAEKSAEPQPDPHADQHAGDATEPHQDGLTAKNEAEPAQTGEAAADTVH